jgi:hypothetical protein
MASSGRTSGDDRLRRCKLTGSRLTRKRRKLLNRHSRRPSAGSALLPQSAKTGQGAPNVGGAARLRPNRAAAGKTVTTLCFDGKQRTL